MSKARLVITAVTIEKRPVSQVARSYGVARSWIYALLARYRAEGEAAFEQRSRRPKTSPTAISDGTAELIIALRKELAGQGLDAGPHTIGWHLAHHHQVTVSAATVSRYLTRAGLVTPDPARRPRSSYLRFEAELPNECWQSDFTHYPLADGTDTEILTWLDDHSRFALSVTAHRRARNTLRAALNHARREELISRNVAELVTLPKSRKTLQRRNSWTVDEARRFLESAREDNDPLYGLWVLILALGLRRGEGLGLVDDDDTVNEEAEEIGLEWQLGRVGGHPLTHKRQLKTDGSVETLLLPPIVLTAVTVEVVARSSPHSFRVLRRRWVVERTFGWLMRYRRLARDYERTTANSEAMIYWATVIIMTRRLTRYENGQPPINRWGGERPCPTKQTALSTGPKRPVRRQPGRGRPPDSTAVTQARRHGRTVNAHRPSQAAHSQSAAERITQMTDGKVAAASGQEASPLRCPEIIRTDRGWERCHRDEHDPGARHHVRDRSWLTAQNTPRLRFGQPCGAACTWPDLTITYRSGTGRKA